MSDDDLDNLRDLAKRQSANHAEKKILAAVAEIERLRSLLRESIRVPQQLNAGALSPVAWRKDYERRVRKALGDE